MGINDQMGQLSAMLGQLQARVAAITPQRAASLPRMIGAGGIDAPNGQGIAYARWQMPDGEVFTGSVRASQAPLGRMIDYGAEITARYLRLPDADLARMLSPQASASAGFAPPRALLAQRLGDRRLLHRHDFALSRRPDGLWVACISVPTQYGPINFCASANEAFITAALEDALGTQGVSRSQAGTIFDDVVRNIAQSRIMDRLSAQIRRFVNDRGARDPFGFVPSVMRPRPDLMPEGGDQEAGFFPLIAAFAPQIVDGVKRIAPHVEDAFRGAVHGVQQGARRRGGYAMAGWKGQPEKVVFPSSGAPQAPPPYAGQPVMFAQAPMTQAQPFMMAPPQMMAPQAAPSGGGGLEGLLGGFGQILGGATRRGGADAGDITRGAGRILQGLGGLFSSRGEVGAFGPTVRMSHADRRTLIQEEGGRGRSGRSKLPRLDTPEVGFLYHRPARPSAQIPMTGRDAYLQGQALLNRGAPVRRIGPGAG